MDGGGSALVVGGGPKCSISFNWDTCFSFGAFEGPEVVLEVASFPRKASFSVEACVGSKVVFVVPMLVG